jgi:hypothetical protein
LLLHHSTLFYLLRLVKPLLQSHAELVSSQYRRLLKCFRFSLHIIKTVTLTFSSSTSFFSFNN